MIRKAGILLPIFSLNDSVGGIGTFGRSAYDFVDFLHDSNINIWQILPLNVTSYGNSPYQSPSSFALNYFFINFDILCHKNLLNKSDYVNVDFGNNKNRVDYGKLFKNKLPILRKAFSRFNKNSPDFISFMTNHKEFSDFAFFMTLKDLNHLLPINKWDEEYRIYTPEIEKEIIANHNDDYLFYFWTQYEAFNEYMDLKRYASKKNVLIMGDLPIYVAYDSVEVYKYGELFQLDGEHLPTSVAGCPPDCFSEDGQLWGNPLYNWSYLKKTNYEFWNKRIYNALSLFDIVRIDHFRGFASYYSIPFSDKNARNGKWIKGPGFDLFKDKLNLNIVAEDLGYIDDYFLELMKKTKYPGMKIITQGFDDINDVNNIWRPSNYTYNFYSYPTTHDSKTCKQYLDDLTEKQKDTLIEILFRECKLLGVSYPLTVDNNDIVEKIIELNYASSCKVCINSLQDLLKIGKEGRINFPSTLTDLNWSYRFSKDQLDSNKEGLVKFLQTLSKRYIRF